MKAVPNTHLFANYSTPIGPSLLSSPTVPSLYTLVARHPPWCSDSWRSPEKKATMQARNDDRKTVETLVRQAQQNHQPAFTSLYELYYAQIFRYVSFKCGSTTEAEDITGEVFLKMIESIHSFRWKGYPFTSWLYRIAHDLVVVYFRNKVARPTAPLDAAANKIGASSSDLEHQASINLTMLDVTVAMDALTDLQREVISLRFGSGFSIAETAETMGKKQNAVKALQHAGLEKLRQALAPPALVPTTVVENKAR